MTRLFSLLWILLLPCCLVAQPRGQPAKHIAKHKYGVGAVAAPPEVFVTVEQNPEFPGGEASLERYLSLNLVYPPMARDNEVQGKVWVRFMIEEDGSTSHVTAIRGIGAGCDEEAVRVVKAMPHWQPRKKNGRPAKAVYVLPISFMLQQ